MHDILQKLYCHDSNLNVWQKNSEHSFAYSDGDKAEQALWDILSSVTDKGVHSEELAKHQVDWSTTYYFSAKRSNLLRPFEPMFRSGRRVLELGCGCGALSRYLAECGCGLCAVEGSLRRASIAALRCSDLPNAHFVVDNILSLPEGLGTFDVITLVGVLEYACRFGGPNAAVELLRVARSHLAPDGKLVVALENKLGLKYFAGVPEDHTCRRWDGVTDSYAREGVKTYSRKELVELLQAAGFTSLAQYIPIPDYKLPVMVITPEGIEKSRTEGAFAGYLGKYRREFETAPVFDMKGAWRSIVKAGLIHEMADSFLFLASEHDVNDIDLGDKNRFIQLYS